MRPPARVRARDAGRGALQLLGGAAVTVNIVGYIRFFEPELRELWQRILGIRKAQEEDAE